MPIDAKKLLESLQGPTDAELRSEVRNRVLELQSENQRLRERLRVTDDQCRRILELTAFIDSQDEWWGEDTTVGSSVKLFTALREILAPSSAEVDKD